MERIKELCIIIGTLLFATMAVAAPTALTYQGRILKSDGTPLTYNNVSFIFQITNPTGSCVIYQEQVTGFNMTNSAGVFDVPIGSGTVSFPLGGGFTVVDTFNNTSTFTCGSCSGYTCTNGTGTYTPVSTDGRLLRVQFFDGAGWQTITPDSIIRSVPFAGFSGSAEKLGTNVASDFLLKAGLPTCGANTFLAWNGIALSCQPVAGSSGGTVTNVTSANSYLTVINSTSTPALTLNVGTVANTVAAGNDPRLSDARTPTGAAGGVLNGSYPNPGLVDSSVTTTKINDGAVSTSKLFANPGVNRLVATDSTTGATLAPLTCTSGQLLIWNVATGWQCANQSSLAAGSATTATTATNFTGSLAGDVSGTQGVTSVDKIKGVPLDFSVAPTNGQVLKFNGTNWAPAADSNAGGTITALTSDVSAAGSGSVAATVNSVGGSTAANIHSAELASNAATNANTVSTIVKRDASGNFSAGIISANLTGIVTGSASLNVLKAGDTMTGNLTFSSNKGNVFTDSGVNTVTVQAPTTISTSYVLKLPTAQGSSSQVLTNDGLGNLSWTTPSTTASSYSGVLPIANGGTNSSIALNNSRIMVSSGGAIVEFSALTNGQLLIGSTGAAPVAASLTAGSGITITPAAGALTIATTGLQASSLADGKIWVGQTGTPTAVTPSGDATMTNAGAFTVIGLRGKTVSATAPSAAGQVLRYDGTSTYAPAFLGLADIKASITPFGGAFASAGCTTSQSLYWQSSTDTFQCQNISVGASNFANQAQNSVLAGPSTGGAGAPVFRALASVDLPSGTVSTSATGTSGYHAMFTGASTLANSSIFESAGNVGIGTTSPSYQLEVRNDQDALTSMAVRNLSTGTGSSALIQVGGNNGQTNLMNFNTTYTTSGTNVADGSLLQGGGNGGLSIAATSNVGITRFYTGGSAASNERMRIDSAGNVGIGTTSPAFPLHIESASGNNVFIHDTLNGTGNTSDLLFGIRGVGNNEINAKVSAIRTDSVTNADTDLTFSTFHSSLSERMRITSSGNVGIGTTAPFVPTIGVDPWLTINSTSPGINLFDRDTTPGYKNRYIRAADGIMGFGRSADDGTGSVDQITLDFAGNVGIGTTAPTYSLDVAGSFRAVSTDIVAGGQVTKLLGSWSSNANDGNGSAGSGIDIYRVPRGGGIQSGTELRFFTGYTYPISTRTQAMTIDQNGNVGIGTASPSYPLHIATVVTPAAASYYNWGYGTAAAITQNTVAPNISIYSNGYIAAAAYLINSDSRIKDIIGQSNSKSDLENLMQIQVTDYRYKDVIRNGSGVTKKVIAQQVEQILPNAIVKRTDFIPNILEVAQSIEYHEDSATIFLKKVKDLAVGDKLRLYNEKNEEDVVKILAITGNGIHVDHLDKNKFDKKVFVYGKQVSDFRSVDYEAIGMLNVSATQELARRLEEQTQENRRLRQELDEIKAKLGMK